jgi:hypothetical protein
MCTMTDEAKDIALRIAGGEDVVSRIVTMKYFTYSIEGEDVIFMDEMRAEVERLAGSTLEEVTPAQFPGDRVLRFARPKLAEVLARLSGS